MKTSSAKAKSRRLQDFVRDTLRYIFKEQLENDDITSRQMGGAGTDVVLTPSARKLIAFDIECKNQENVSIPAALRQASDNAMPDRIPLVVFKKNHGKVYVALEYNHFMKLVYNADVDAIKKFMADQEKQKSQILIIEESQSPQ